MARNNGATAEAPPVDSGRVDADRPAAQGAAAQGAAAVQGAAQREVPPLHYEKYTLDNGLEALPDADAEAEIRTDSGYSIGVLQKGWKAKANPDLIATIRKELAKRPKVRLVYVPGHAGVDLNERADELAREAIKTRSSKPMSPATP